MAEKDIAEKTLESYNDVFADIINVLLFQGRHLLKEEELEEKQPRAVYKTDGKLREIERDVLKQWKKEDICIACIGLENQTNSDVDMPLRVMGYDGAEYRAQLLKKQSSERYPVLTLVLHFDYEKRWNKSQSLKERLTVPEELQMYVCDYKYNLFEIAYLSDEQLDQFESDFWVVADYFVQMRKNRDYRPKPRPIRHVQETLHLLSVLTGDTRFEEACQEQEEGVHTMCEVLDRIENQGIQKGIEKGIEKGTLSERERTVRRMYLKGYTVKDISDIVEISEKAVRMIVGEPVLV